MNHRHVQHMLVHCTVITCNYTYMHLQTGFVEGVCCGASVQRVDSSCMVVRYEMWKLMAS